MRALSAAIALAMLAPTAWPQAAVSAVSLVEATVVSVDRGRRTITVRESSSGAVRTLNVERAASLAAARAGSPVVLTLRGSTVTAINARGGAAPPAQEVPQLPPGAAAPQNRGVPQLPPGSDAPQARPIPQVPAVSPAPAPRPAISPVTGPSPKPVVLPSDPPPSPAS